MKKMLFFAAMSAIALTSCVNDSATEGYTPKAQVMRFDGPAMFQGRANVMGEINGVLYDVEENFKVFSKYYKDSYAGWNNTLGNYFQAGGDIAKNEDGGKYWSTETTYYWPDHEYNLAFAAYSPAVLTTEPTSIEQTETGLVIKGFQTEADANNQYDLMYSDRVVDRNNTNNGHGAVPLVFHHALSSIVFSSEKEDNNVEYAITDLKVTGDFIQKGDFNQNINEATDNKTSGTATWDFAGYTASQANYVPNFDDFNVTTTPNQFTQGKSALLLIPQNVPANAQVEITYTKTTNETTMINTAKILLSDFAQEGGNRITTWEMGKRYVYRIAFGQNKRIYFEPTTTNWVQEGTLIYTIQ